ncbi:disease resistance protein RUN1-like [Prosopis cineraria]|uniref:disease resistance protein RUN1-like n=1 Tax=Prosopis cineraria TaxID=364024 RepID=UPI0024100CE6|nr:disease resistance protein RUN1-like [Prosopis cineraria]
MKNLAVLDAKEPQKLVNLLQSILNLKCLALLDIARCSKFARLPENLEIEALEVLDASGTNITEVPSSIGGLKKLERLSFHGCKWSTSSSWSLALPLSDMFWRHSIHKGLILSASIFNVKSLAELNLSNCNIDAMPDDLRGLSSLRILDLSGNKFVNLPGGCIYNLSNLQFLYLNSCSRLELLTQCGPRLWTMDAGESTSLETVSDEQLLHLFASIDRMERLRRNEEQEQWSSLSLSENSQVIIDNVKQCLRWHLLHA